MNDALAWRRETRTRCLDARMKMPAAEHRAASIVVERLLEGVLHSLPAGVLSGYLPFKHEIDIRPLMHRLREQGWTIALPAVVAPKSPLEFLLWDRDSEMTPGAYGIPVPRAWQPVRPDVVIAPMVAFDRANFRLGYGAGYFDITLGGMSPRPRAIGVSFELARLNTIHPRPEDIPMDLVITEAGIQEPL